MSENLQPDTEIGTETCEPANKKQKLEPSFHSSSETASASTVLEPMGMEEWVCYEECTPSDTWAANIALTMEDWPSMDCDKVIDCDMVMVMDTSKKIECKMLFVKCFEGGQGGPDVLAT
ncbi:hypothetical protein BGZ74_004875, partial [Mortierella antarctica]